MDTTAIITKDKGRIGTAYIARFDFNTEKDEEISSLRCLMRAAYSVIISSLRVIPGMNLIYIIVSNKLLYMILML